MSHAHVQLTWLSLEVVLVQLSVLEVVEGGVDLNHSCKMQCYSFYLSPVNYYGLTWPDN